ncbi:hypothetical protein DXZ75_41950 [Streptomyces sp. AcE210]|nr:hypothetical protein DXZ75_41950 [Streptomyces sp. AcE210]
MCGLSCVHTLGTAKLSRLCPQGPALNDHQTRSGGCGFVDKRSPQAVDKIFLHRVWVPLSTVDPQVRGPCAQLRAASPHGCPLFGNATCKITVPSERRHIKGCGWAVGNRGKAGDSPGEKWPRPVYRVCRTFPRPQRTPVVHRSRPQARWTKNRL